MPRPSALRFALVGFALTALTVSGASATPTLIVSGGQLLGATGVDVGGTLYDVAFIDGTCIGLFSGCNEVSDFTFQTSPDATLAAQALLEHVFLDGANLFDTDPELTSGCSAAGSCTAWTPFFTAIGTVSLRGAFNDAVETSDAVKSIGLSTGGDFSFDPAGVFAVWAVPEPPLAALFVVGLVAMGLHRKNEGSWPPRA